jgi:hypothetical protein
MRFLVRHKADDGTIKLVYIDAESIEAANRGAISRGFKDHSFVDYDSKRGVHDNNSDSVFRKNLNKCGKNRLIAICLLIPAFLMIAGMVFTFYYRQIGHTWNGEIFIKTKGGENLSLSLVDVYYIEPTPQAYKNFSNWDARHKGYYSVSAGDNNSEIFSLRMELINAESESRQSLKTHNEILDARGQLELLVAQSKDNINKMDATLKALQIRKEIERLENEDNENKNVKNHYEYCKSNYTGKSVSGSDGTFVISSKCPSIIIVAYAERTILNNVEKYYWFLRIPSSESKLSLNNNNLADLNEMVDVKSLFAIED